MNPLQQLASQALLGTEHRAPQAVPVAGALGELLEHVCGPDDGIEACVLRRAGVLAVCADAGFVPGQAPDQPPPPCAAEVLRPVSDAGLAAVLQRIVEDGPDLLRHEALARLAANAVCLPPRVLPRALSLGQQLPDLRPALLPVIGTRGAWLASQNPDWRFAAGAVAPAPDAQVWEIGTLEQRVRWLGNLRETDPDQARSRMQAALGELDARERASLLGLFAIGLAPADEPLLEGVLADRSKEVRQLAANLLGRLNGSRYLARMGERMETCLRVERKLLGQVTTLEAPAQFGPDWKADALEPSRPRNERLGERAWWLYQLACRLPLAWWTARLGKSAAELVAWGRGSDWSEAILRAWSESLRRDPDPDWARAFLRLPPTPGVSLDGFELVACLPAAEREQRWLAMLEAGPQSLARGELLARIVAALGPERAQMSASFARTVLARVRADLHTDACKWDYALRRSLPEFVCLIPPACFADATEGWPAAAPGNDSLGEALARVLAVIDQRKILHRTLT